MKTPITLLYRCRRCQEIFEGDSFRHVVPDTSFNGPNGSRDHFCADTISENIVGIGELVGGFKVPSKEEKENGC